MKLYVKSVLNRPLARELVPKTLQVDKHAKEKKRIIKAANDRNIKTGVTRVTGALNIKAPFKFSTLMERSPHTFGADNHEENMKETLEFIYNFQ